LSYNILTHWTDQSKEESSRRTHFHWSLENRFLGMGYTAFSGLAFGIRPSKKSKKGQKKGTGPFFHFY